MSVDTASDYFTACLGQTRGWLIVATGKGPHLEAGRYTHEQWSEQAYRWPTHSRRALEAIAAAAPTADVYACPYSMRDKHRVKGNAVTHQLVHADVDGELDPEAVKSLDGFAVSSGTPGHAHVYVRLTYAVTAVQHELLCRGLAEYLHADCKVSDNDLLRPPGTLNHKSAAAGGDPAPANWLVPWDGAWTDPRVLATVLEVDIEHAEREPSSATDWRAMAFTPFPLEDYPTVAAVLGDGSGDRSRDTIRILSACFDAGLTLPHGRWVLQQRDDLKARLQEFAARPHPIDDAAVCWSKIAPGLVVATPGLNGEASPASPGTAARGTALQDALEVFGRWLYLDDIAPVLAVAAAVVANLAEGDPVWLLVVGPPSSGKTEILSALAGLPYIVPAAAITEAALLSGTPRKERSGGATGGLLRRVGEFGILLTKDFTSVLSQHRDTAAQATAALREIYDGTWDRPLGADGGRTLHWHGKCGFIGGVTPSYDRYWSVTNALGDRYLLLRLPETDPAKQARAARAHARQGQQMRGELAAAMSALIATADLAAVGVSDEDGERLDQLAIYAARTRTAVTRNGYTGEIEVLPEPEGPARLVKALCQLSGGLSALGVGDVTRWSLLGHVAIDCTPAIRTALLRRLIASAEPLRTAQLATEVGLVTKTAGRVLSDLALVGVVRRTKKSAANNSPDLWEPAAWLTEYWPEKWDRSVGSEKAHPPK
jgi:hypothetical protein